jgi:hypothetical protein
MGQMGVFKGYLSINYDTLLQLRISRVSALFYRKNDGEEGPFLPPSLFFDKFSEAIAVTPLLIKVC